MFLGVRSTPFSVAEFPFSPPFSKQNGGELTFGPVPEHDVVSAFRPTLAVSELSDLGGNQPPHPSSISDFLRASRPAAHPLQHRSGALDRSTVHTLDAGCLSSGS